MIKIDPNIELGKNFLMILDESLKPEACFWFYLPDSKSWRFVISSRAFNDDLRKSYEEFAKNFGQNRLVQEIGLSNITLLPTHSDLLKLLRTAIKTNSKSISGVRFTSNVINGVLIEDAYIYRLV